MEQLDPEMINHLELLLDYEIVTEEADWDVLENMEEAEVADDEPDAQEEP